MRRQFHKKLATTPTPVPVIKSKRHVDDDESPSLIDPTPKISIVEVSVTSTPDINTNGVHSFQSAPMNTCEKFEAIMGEFCQTRAIQPIYLLPSMTGNYPVFKRLVEKILLTLFMTSPQGAVDPDLLADCDVRLSPDEDALFNSSANFAMNVLRQESWSSDFVHLLTHATFINSTNIGQSLKDYGCTLCNSTPGCTLVEHAYQYRSYNVDDIHNLKISYASVKDLHNESVKDFRVYFDLKCSNTAKMFTLLYQYRMILIQNCYTKLFVPYCTSNPVHSAGKLSDILASNFILTQYTHYRDSICVLMNVAAAEHPVSN
jgi:hypothetical protein